MEKEIQRPEKKDYLVCKNNIEALASKAWKYWLYQILKDFFEEETINNKKEIEEDKEWLYNWLNNLLVEKKSKEIYKNIQKLLNDEKITEEEKEGLANLLNNENFFKKSDIYLEEHLIWTREEIEEWKINIESMITILFNKIVKQDILEVLWETEIKQILEEYWFDEESDDIDNIEFINLNTNEKANYFMISINNDKFFFIDKETKAKKQYDSFKEMKIWEENYYIVWKNNKKRVLDEDKEWNLTKKFEAEDIHSNLTEFWYFIVEKENKDFVLVNEDFEEIENIVIDEDSLKHQEIESFNFWSIDYKNNEEIIKWNFVIWAKVNWEEKILIIDKNWKINIFDEIKRYYADIFSFDKEKNETSFYSISNSDNKINLKWEIKDIYKDYIISSIWKDFYIYNRKTWEEILDNYQKNNFINWSNYYAIKSEEKYIIFNRDNKEEITLDKSDFSYALDILNWNLSIENFEKYKKTFNYKWIKLFEKIGERFFSN